MPVVTVFRYEGTHEDCERFAKSFLISVEGTESKEVIAKESVLKVAPNSQLESGEPLRQKGEVSTQVEACGLGPSPLPSTPSVSQGGARAAAGSPSPRPTAEPVCPGRAPMQNGSRAITQVL